MSENKINVVVPKDYNGAPIEADYQSISLKETAIMDVYPYIGR